MSIQFEKETIRGFDIEKRELTEEEASREITLERFRVFHEKVGEDFCDQITIANPLIFGGFLLAKYPEIAAKVLDLCNSKHKDNHMFEALYEEEFDDIELNKFYTDYAELLNLTTFSKKEVNQILIQIDEHYSD